MRQRRRVHVLVAATIPLAMMSVMSIAGSGLARATEPPLCALDDASGVLTVTPPVAGVTLLQHDAGTIYVNDVACGTLTTVDRIDVASTSVEGNDITILAPSGPWGPGRTDEGDGTSEIEFGFLGHVRLTIQGSDGAERFAAGVSGSDARFNLDTSEPEADADLQVSNADLLALTIVLGAGADTFDGTGGHGTGGFFFSLGGVPVIVEMGGGDDQVSPSVSDAGIFDGGPGTDAFSVRSFACGSFLNLLEETGSLCGTGPIFGLISLEHVSGTRGDDLVVTTVRDEVIRGLGGNDTIDGSRGADTFEGGPGSDGVGYGQLDRGIAGDLRSGSVIGGGDDALSSIEILGGTAHADILLGSARDERLYGSAGRDELFGRRGADLHDGGDGRDDCHQRNATAGDTFTACER